MFVVFDSFRVQKSQTIFKKMINMIYSVCFQKKKSKQKFPKNKNKKPDPSTKTPKFQRIPRGPNGSKGSENVFTRCDYASNFSARDQLQYFRTLDLSERVQALQRLLLSGAAGTLAVAGCHGVLVVVLQVFCLFDSGFDVGGAKTPT